MADGTEFDLGPGDARMELVSQRLAAPEPPRTNI
jgi:hypothetical protein